MESGLRLGTKERATAMTINEACLQRNSGGTSFPRLQVTDRGCSKCPWCTNLEKRQGSLFMRCKGYEFRGPVLFGFIPHLTLPFWFPDCCNEMSLFLFLVMWPWPSSLMLDTMTWISEKCIWECLEAVPAWTQILTCNIRWARLERDKSISNFCSLCVCLCLFVSVSLPNNLMHGYPFFPEHLGMMDRFL